MTLTCVSIFSGAGGLDIGFERAGFRAVSMCEYETRFADTLVANQGWRHCDGRRYFDGSRIVCRDIRDVSGRSLAGGVAIDCLIGGPPCQAFSSSGKQLSVLDARGGLVDEFVRMVSEIRPKSFVFENVRGIVTARDRAGVPGGVIRSLFQSLEDLGYGCRAALLNAADYGAYQRRVRCFIMGVRNGEVPEFPAATHGRAGKSSPGLFVKPWKSLRDFLRDHGDSDRSNYVYPTAALAAQLASCPDGSGLKSAGAAEPTRPGGHWGYRQGTFIADLDLPARTVTGSSSQDWIRWEGELRRLTFLEVMRLQGFPGDWKLCGTKADTFKQIGNAVPACFGELLGGVLSAHLANPTRKKAVRVGWPREFDKYIRYTMDDEAKNGAARKVHRKFGGLDKASARSVS